MSTLVDQLSEFGAGIIDEILVTMQAVGPVTPLEAPADNSGTKRLMHMSQITRPTTVPGFVHLVIPFVNYAKVQSPNGQGIFRCSTASMAQVPDHGDCVTASVDLDMGVGVVTHAKPDPRIYASQYWSDVISHGSGVGFYGQEVYRRFISESADRGSALDFGNGRPIDQLPGDWGHIFDTGIGFHADPMMFFARVSETVGVFGFYLDGTLRVTGDTLEVESDAVVSVSGNDEGELFEEVNRYFTPWEAVGLTGPDAELTIEENAPADVVRKGGRVWAIGDNPPVPFSRVVTYGGYAGQGLQTIVYAMPQVSGKSTYSQEAINETFGLSRIAQLIDGTVLVESAKSIIIAKSGPIYVPVRQHHRSSSDGSSLAEGNYRFSGVYIKKGSNPPEHDNKYYDVHTTGGANREATKPLRIADVYAQTSVWMAGHTFYYNEDFEISQSPLYDAPADIEIGECLTSDVVTVKPGKELYANHLERHLIHKLLSLISIANDGAITIREARGGSITLAGGVVSISGTSIRLMGGKNTVIHSGRIAMNAATDVDILATDGRLRAAAGKDMELLSANSGVGGMLIENRGAGEQQVFPDDPDKLRIGGVVIKSDSSPLQVLSAGCYIRTGLPGAKVATGPIILDANGGADAIYMRAGSHYRFTSASFVDAFGTTPGSIFAVNLYGAHNNIFHGALSTLGGVASRGSIQAVGDIVATGQVGTASEPQRIVNNLNGVAQSESAARVTTVTSFNSQIITRFEAAGRLGHPATAAGVSFGFPNSKSYDATDVVLSQPYWAEVASVIGIRLHEEWAGRPVVYRPKGKAKNTTCWPGWERVHNSASIATLDLSEGPTINQTFDTARMSPYQPDPERYTQPQLGRKTYFESIHQKLPHIKG